MHAFVARRFSALRLSALACGVLGALSIPAAAFADGAAAPAATATATLPPLPETGDQPRPDHWPMKFDLGVGVGYDGFSKNTGLGNSDYLLDASGKATTTRLVTLKDSVLVGVRGTAWLFEGLGIGDLGVEVEGKYAPASLTGANGSSGRANIFGVRALAIYKFLDAEAVVRPFINAGGGVDIFKSADSAATLQAKKLYVSSATDADSAWMVGGGAQWQALHDMGVRLDARFVSTRGLGADATVGRSSHPITGNFEAMLAFVYTLGGKPGDSDGDGILDPYDKCVEQAEDRDGFQDNDGCPEADNDGDGVLDAEDKCPNDAEDKDGFQDYDGCPDLDNDGDGINDNADKCPDKAEDKDGFQDADGCPDPDNDQDGIPDVADKCKNAPEDKDGFQDDDGCPDLDNDNDGVLDAQDKCPNQAETKNFYQDVDGCPDTIPDDLTKVVETKVTLKWKGAALDEKSAEVAIAPIVNALEKHDVKITLKLQSATSDAAGAQAKAELIKAFILKGHTGINPDRIAAVGESVATVAPPATTGPAVQEAPAASDDDAADTGKKGKKGKKAKKAKAKKVKKAKAPKKAKAGKKGKKGAAPETSDTLTIQLR